MKTKTIRVAQLVLGALILFGVTVNAAEHDGKTKTNGTGRSVGDLKAYGPIMTQIEKLGGKTGSTDADSAFTMKDGDREVKVRPAENQLFSDFFSQAETLRDGLNACPGTSAMRTLLDHCVVTELGGVFFDSMNFTSGGDGKTAFSGDARTGDLEFNPNQMQACFLSLHWMLTKRAKNTDLEKGLQESVTKLAVLFSGKDDALKSDSVKKELDALLNKDALSTFKEKHAKAMKDDGLKNCEIKAPNAGSGSGSGKSDDEEAKKKAKEEEKKDRAEADKKAKEAAETNPNGKTGAGGVAPSKTPDSGVGQSGQGNPFQGFGANGLGGFGNNFPIDDDALALRDDRGTGLEELIAKALQDDNDDRPQIINPPASNSRGGNAAAPATPPPTIPGINIPPRPPSTPVAQNDGPGMPQMGGQMYPPPAAAAPAATPPPWLTAARENNRREPEPVPRKSQAEIEAEAREKVRDEFALNNPWANPNAQQQQQVVSTLRNAERLLGRSTAAKGSGSNRPSTRSRSKSSGSKSRTMSSSSQRAKNTKVKAFNGTGGKMNTVNGKGQVKDGKVSAGAKAVR